MEDFKELEPDFMDALNRTTLQVGKDKPKKDRFMKDDKSEPQITYSLQDVVDAVQYGFYYRVESQNDGKAVPVGNILQWLMMKKDLIYVPKEFKEFKDGKQ